MDELLTALTPTAPNPIVKASAVVPPNIAIAAFDGDFIRLTSLASCEVATSNLLLLMANIHLCNYCHKAGFRGHALDGAY